MRTTVLNHEYCVVLWSCVCVYFSVPASLDPQPVRRVGRLMVRRVDVPELDQRFAEVAECFNQQQEHYETMVRHVKNLRRSYGCARDDDLTFAECVKVVREEQREGQTFHFQAKQQNFMFFFKFCFTLFPSLKRLSIVFL